MYDCMLCMLCNGCVLSVQFALCLLSVVCVCLGGGRTVRVCLYVSVYLSSEEG